MLATQGGCFGVRQQLLERISRRALAKRRICLTLYGHDSNLRTAHSGASSHHFYVGHLEAFDWNLLHENVLGLKSFHPEFDRLFAFGIDPVGGGLPSDQPSDWPSAIRCKTT